MHRSCAAQSTISQTAIIEQRADRWPDVICQRCVIQGNAPLQAQAQAQAVRARRQGTHVQKSEMHARPGHPSIASDTGRGAKLTGVAAGRRERRRQAQRSEQSMNGHRRSLAFVRVGICRFRARIAAAPFLTWRGLAVAEASPS
jgi:hypothetical protein